MSLLPGPTDPLEPAEFEILEVMSHPRIQNAWIAWTRIVSGFPHVAMKLRSSAPPRSWEVSETGGWQPSPGPPQPSFTAITIRNLTDSAQPVKDMRLVQAQL